MWLIHMFFRLYLPWQWAHSSLQLLTRPWICAPGTHYGWVDQDSVEYEVCLTLLHMANTRNWTPDLLILSPTWPHLYNAISSSMVDWPDLIKWLFSSVHSNEVVALSNKLKLRECLYLTCIDTFNNDNKYLVILSARIYTIFNRTLQVWRTHRQKSVHISAGHMDIALTLTVPVTTIDALQHFETG